MGGIHRLKKSIKQPGVTKIAMADTKSGFGQCRVFLGHPDPQVAANAAVAFPEFMRVTVERARKFNISDMYEAHFQTLKKIENGIPLTGEPGDD